MCYGTLEIWVWKDGEPELWTEGNGHLPWGKAKPNLKGCGAKEEEKEDEEEEEEEEEEEADEEGGYVSSLPAVVLP